VFDDCHDASEVTLCEVPSERDAVAVNCEVAPTAGDEPLTLTDVTVAGEGVGPGDGLGVGVGLGLGDGVVTMGIATVIASVPVTL